MNLFKNGYQYCLGDKTDFSLIVARLKSRNVARESAKNLREIDNIR